MKHIAILRQPFFDLVLSGQKTIESRFSMKKVASFDKIKVGDDILLKQTGKPVTAMRSLKCYTIKDIWELKSSAVRFLQM